MKTRKFADLVAKARADPERSRRIDAGVQELLREIAAADSRAGGPRSEPKPAAKSDATAPVATPT